MLQEYSNRLHLEDGTYFALVQPPPGPHSVEDGLGQFDLELHKRKGGVVKETGRLEFDQINSRSNTSDAIGSGTISVRATSE